MQAIAGAGPDFGVIDYTKSSFHSGIIKHDMTHPISGLHTVQDDAFDQADAETLEREAFRQQKMKTQSHHDKQAMLRGRDATLRVKAERDL